MRNASKTAAICLLLCAFSHAQNGCGDTKNWTDASCQTIGSGSLSSAWTVVSRHGEYAQSETECNIPSAVSIDGGLVITTTANAYTCGDFNANGTVRNTAASWSYSTGDVQWNTFNFLHGSIEFRSTYPAQGTHLWPAHWLLTAACQETNKYSGDVGFSGCPSFGATGYDEIDILEGLGSMSMNLYHNGGSSVCGISTWDASSHLWLLNWTSSAVTLSRDGTQICNLTTNIPTTAMFLIIQTQTGGAAGAPVNGLLPASLKTEYVQVKNESGTVIFYDDFSAPTANPAQFAGAAKLSGAAAVK